MGKMLHETCKHESFSTTYLERQVFIKINCVIVVEIVVVVVLTILKRFRVYLKKRLFKNQ